MDIKKIANILLAIFVILVAVQIAVPLLMLPPMNMYYGYPVAAIGIITGLLWLFATFRE